MSAAESLAAFPMRDGARQAAEKVWRDCHGIAPNGGDILHVLADAVAVAVLHRALTEIAITRLGAEESAVVAMLAEFSAPPVAPRTPSPVAALSARPSNREPESGAPHAAEAELPRYGLTWNGPRTPVSVEMPDGHWTPWHLAAAALRASRAQAQVIRMQCADSLTWEADCAALRAQVEQMQQQIDKGLDYEHHTSCGHIWTMRATACPQCFADLRKRLRGCEVARDLSADYHEAVREEFGLPDPSTNAIVDRLRIEIARAEAAEPDAALREVCICAAIKIGDLVVRGHRHNHCLATAGLIPGLSRDDIRSGVQGFVTSTNRFVDRREAMRLQVAAGVKSCHSRDGELRGEILFSEDLY